MFKLWEAFSCKEVKVGRLMVDGDCQQLSAAAVRFLREKVGFRSKEVYGGKGWESC